VQAELEKALRRLFRKKIRVAYAGRTDKGVHAKAQVVNFKIDTDIPAYSIKKALNTYLPEDISVTLVKFVPLDFHARFSAKSKVYRYIVFNKKEQDVFIRNYSWFVPYKVDIERMKKASRLLEGRKDFSSFAQEASTYKTCRRHLKNIVIKKRDGFINIDIEADGFLRGMARNIVGFLVNIGLGRRTLGEIRGVISSRNRNMVGKAAPACGLYLWRVKY